MMKSIVMLIPFLVIYVPILGASIYAFILFVKLAKRGIKALDIYIEENKIVRKEKVMVQNLVQGLFKCKNPRCVSNFDEYVTPKFELSHKNHKILYKCNYCEELTSYKI